jgi:lysophospholipase L1-like esterase
VAELFLLNLIQEKVILCYGDSNTWGQDPFDLIRLPLQQRWAGLLQKELSTAEVIKNGLPERSIKDLNHREKIVSVIESHYKIDLLILSLGINDFHRTNLGSIDDYLSNYSGMF